MDLKESLMVEPITTATVAAGAVAGSKPGPARTLGCLRRLGWRAVFGVEASQFPTKQGVSCYAHISAKYIAWIIPYSEPAKKTQKTPLDIAQITVKSRLSVRWPWAPSSLSN